MSDWTDEPLQLIDDCEKRERKLSAWDVDFLDSLRTRLEAKKPLTEKQTAMLDAIWERVTAY